MEKKALKVLSCLSLVALSFGILENVVKVNAATLLDSTHKDTFETGISDKYQVVNDANHDYKLFEKPGVLKMSNYDYNNGFVHLKDAVTVPEGKSLVVQFDMVDAVSEVSGGWFALAKGGANFSECWGDMIYYSMKNGSNMVNEANGQVGYQEGTVQSAWANSHLYGVNSLQRQVYNADGSAQMYGSASSLAEADLHMFYEYKAGQITKTGSGLVGFMGNGLTGSVTIDNFKVGIADDKDLTNLTWLVEDDFENGDNWTIEEAASATTLIGGAAKYLLADNPEAGSGIRYNTKIEQKETDKKEFETNLDIEIQELTGKKALGLACALQDEDQSTANAPFIGLRKNLEGNSELVAINGGVEVQVVALETELVGAKVTLNVNALVEDGEVRLVGKALGKEVSLLLDSVDGYVSIATLPGVVVPGDGQLKMTNYNYSGGYAFLKNPVTVPEGKSLVVQFEMIDGAESVESGSLGLAKGGADFNESWADMIYYSMKSGTNQVNEANGQVGYHEGTAQQTWTNSHLYGMNSLQRQVYNPDGSAQMYGAASSLKESDLAMFYEYKAGQLSKTGTGLVGFMGNAIVGSVTIDNFKVGIADDKDLTNLTWLVEDSFANLNNWEVVNVAEGISTELVNVVEGIEPKASAKINGFEVMTFKNVEETGRDLETDFSENVDRHYHLTSAPAQADANGYARVEDGKLNFQHTGDGTYFGPAYKYVNFELQFDIDFQQLDEDDDGNVIKESTWCGISIGRKTIDAAYWQGILLYQGVTTLDALGLEFDPTSPGYGGATRTWIAPENDYRSTVNAGQTFTIKVVAQDGTLSYYSAKKGGEFVLHGRALNVDTDGYIAIATTEGGDFMIDNFSIKNLDKTGYYDSKVELAPNPLATAKFYYLDSADVADKVEVGQDGLIQLHENRKVLAEIEVDPHYELVSVKLDNQELVAENGLYSFDLPDTDTKLQVETKPRKYAVQFGEAAAQQLDYDTVITIPAGPEKADDEQYTYTFDGWYNGEIKLVEGTKVTGDVTFVARYTQTAKEQPSVEPSVEPSTETSIVPSEAKSEEAQPETKKKGCRGEATTSLLGLLAIAGALIFKKRK